MNSCLQKQNQNTDLKTTDEEIDEAIELSQKAKIEKTEEIVGELKELVTQKAQQLVQNMNEADDVNDDNAAESDDSDENKTDTEEIDVSDENIIDKNFYRL